MARHNEILDGHFNELLSRRLSTKDGAPAPVLSSDVMPTIALEVDRPEWGFLKRENRFSAGQTVLGAASNVASIRLRNPANSGVIAVVERLRVVSIESAGNVNVFSELTNAQLGLANGVAGPLDTRLLTAANIASQAISACLLSTSATDFAPNGIAIWLFSGNNTDWEPNLTLAPGGAVTLQTVADDVNLSACFQWRERRAQPGELVQ